MPKVRSSSAKIPEGWDLIEPTLMELERKMRDVESESHEGKRKAESVWPIFRIHHQRSRYLYDMFHKKQEISRELYDWCLKEGYGDVNLIAKWKKPGYERLCCLRCIQTKDHVYATTCICRVSRDRLEPGKVVECVHCGCRGCNTADIEATLTLPQFGGSSAADTAHGEGGVRGLRPERSCHGDGGQGGQPHSGWAAGSNAAPPQAAHPQYAQYPYPYPFPPGGAESAHSGGSAGPPPPLWHIGAGFPYPVPYPPAAYSDNSGPAPAAAKGDAGGHAESGE